MIPVIYRRKLADIGFQITFSETNVRYLLEQTPVNHKLVEFHRKKIAECKKTIDMYLNPVKITL